MTACTYTGQTLQEDGEDKVVQRTMRFGGDSEFESCDAGQTVHVIRELPDHTFTIKTDEGIRLLHGDAFTPPGDDDLIDVNLNMFNADA
jgi:hypothetical protein